MVGMVNAAGKWEAKLGLKLDMRFSRDSCTRTHYSYPPPFKPKANVKKRRRWDGQTSMDSSSRRHQFVPHRFSALVTGSPLLLLRILGVLVSGGCQGHMNYIS